MGWKPQNVPRPFGRFELIPRLDSETKMATRNTKLVQSLEFLEVLKFAQQFSRAGKKVWKMEIKSGKMVKSLEFVFLGFFKATTSALEVKCFLFWSNLIQSRPCVCSTPCVFFMSLLIAYLLTLRLEKEIIVLEKSLEEVLNFGSKNLYEPW